MKPSPKHGFFKKGEPESFHRRDLKSDKIASHADKKVTSKEQGQSGGNPVARLEEKYLIIQET